MPTGPALSAAGRKLKAKRAGLARHRGPDHAETVEAARDYRAGRQHARNFDAGHAPSGGGVQRVLTELRTLAAAFSDS